MGIYAETHVFAAGFRSFDLGFRPGVRNLFKLVILSEGYEIALISDYWFEDLILILFNYFLIAFLKILRNLHSIVSGTFLTLSLRFYGLAC